jgi:hypothetical protein
MLMIFFRLPESRASKPAAMVDPPTKEPISRMSFGYLGKVVDQDKHIDTEHGMIGGFH